MEQTKNAFSEINEAIHALLKEKYPAVVYNLWFGSMTVQEMDDKEIVFEIPSDFKCATLQKRYTEVIEEIVEEVVGFPVTAAFVSTETEMEELTEEEIAAAPIPLTKEEKEQAEFIDKIEGNSIVAGYTFDNFIVGESNKFAHAACLRVAQEPFTAYNPLFIYGASGLGKTHLLFAITNEIKMNKPGAKIVYMKGEDFINEVVNGIRTGTMPFFRSRCCTADVLLIDDIQFIAGKASTQEEFFHTFSILYENQKQIILTSDRPPKEINPLEERLLSRFEWGLIADIQPPSEELRNAIIRQKADSLGITIPNDALSFLTNSLQKNIRQIEGAIKKIEAISSLSGTPITLDLCRRAIADIVSGIEPSPVTVDRIFRVVGEHFGVSVEDIKGKKRDAGVAQARHMSIYLIRNNTNLPLKEIGKQVLRDHATVIASIRRIVDEIKTIPSTRALVDELTEKIKVDH
ncbi:MAG: chromosomal replication initiator protein DnaA [Clostridia bacterium]|nr:chromosomal replication initiator protein DnaA [Clostridia bacterium]MBO7170644.1 chromosomal replication initiator protein DnaA [Clostridia bacterium]